MYSKYIVYKPNTISCLYGYSHNLYNNMLYTHYYHKNLIYLQHIKYIQELFPDQ